MEIRHEVACFPAHRITAAPHGVVSATRRRGLGARLCGWFFQLQSRRKWIVFITVYLAGVLVGVLAAQFVDLETLFFGLSVVSPEGETISTEPRLPLSDGSA